MVGLSTEISPITMLHPKQTPPRHLTKSVLAFEKYRIRNTKQWNEWELLKSFQYIVFCCVSALPLRMACLASHHPSEEWTTTPSSPTVEPGLDRGIPSSKPSCLDSVPLTWLLLSPGSSRWRLYAEPLAWIGATCMYAQARYSHWGHWGNAHLFPCHTEQRLGLSHLPMPSK